ncbi:hypothetical protein BC834DRAFT_863600 [Gloeopeniophorella convolvens]|nr:hypothetical protein BC834DRAFT_863600 [Gloeopeniophorella convolvens]
MGFFSSRRHHENDAFIDTATAQSKEAATTSPGVIRSRFYGKNKGKGRETDGSPLFEAHSPLAESRTELNLSHTSPTVNSRRLPRDGPMRSVSESVLNMHTSSAHQASRSPGQSNPRPSTDAITVMLAQRLTELASANAEGLLDDDEYRLLRQNLFERLGKAEIPKETPVVPTAGPSRPLPATPLRADSVRSPSVQSRATVSSAVSGLLRRATGRRNGTTDTDTLHSDSNSVFSVGSNSPNTFTRRLLRMPLSKHRSEASLRTERSPSTPDNISVTSPTAGRGRPEDADASRTPSISRSSTTRSKRRAPPPPSAFHARINGSEPKRIHSILDDALDDEDLRSSKEIRAQIEAIEAEGRRLMDAFNGLELSALTRKSRGNQIPALPSSGLFPQSPQDGMESLDSTWTFQGSLQPPRDADGLSLRSTTSNGTSLSAHRSPIRGARTTPNSPLVSQPVSLGRKSSFSSVSGAPHLPSLPASLGRLGIGSSSSVNLTRSAGHLPLAPVVEGDSRESIEAHARHLRVDTSPSGPQGLSTLSPRRNDVIGDDADIAALEVEMTEIRRRRAEVMGRYEERLSYLRAKLKGAELHEKLLRR